MLNPGHQFGHYKILRLIGRGGMADVYEAQMQAGMAEKRVALKLLLPKLAKDSAIVNCFIDEARLAAKLSHPNIVQVFDFGETEARLFLAMEYVDGLDLHDVLRYCKGLRRLMPVPAVLYVIHEVAFALAYIHSLKPPIIHRDVTPQNVFLARDGTIRLGDFGVAKSAMNRAVTEAGVVKGKISYLAPEQARGEPVCRRTDVFAAGLMLFEMLTGQRMIRGETDMELVFAAQSPKLIAPSSISPDAAPLDRLVMTALQPAVDRRLRSADLLTQHLETFLDRTPFDATSMAALLMRLERSADVACIPTQLEEEDKLSELLTIPVQLPVAPPGGPVQVPKQQPPSLSGVPSEEKPITELWTGQQSVDLPPESLGPASSAPAMAGMPPSMPPIPGTEAARPELGPTGPDRLSDDGGVAGPRRPTSLQRALKRGEFSEGKSQLLQAVAEPRSGPMQMGAGATGPGRRAVDSTGPIQLGAESPRRRRVDPAGPVPRVAAPGQPRGPRLDSTGPVALAADPSPPILVNSPPASQPPVDPPGAVLLTTPSSRERQGRRRRPGKRSAQISDAQWWIMSIIVLGIVVAFVVLTLWKG